MSDIQNKIDSYFDKLTDFIEKLPLSEFGKKLIWLDSFEKFYDTQVLDENGSVTYGIQTEWQLNRFHEQFVKNIKKLRLKEIEKWIDRLHKMDVDEATEIVSRQLYEIRKKKLLAELDGQKTNDWQNWVEKLLLNEKEYLSTKKYQKNILTKPQATGFNSKLTDNQIEFLYNELKDANFIDERTSLKDFATFFNGGDLTGKKIIWIDKSLTRHEPNKQTIYELLYLLRDFNYIENNEINNTTATNPNNLYNKLKAVFPNIKNFQQTNPFESKKDTLRKERLHEIVSKLDKLKS